MEYPVVFRLGVLLGAALAMASAAAAPVPVAGGECQPGKGIERTLGKHGYRVVGSGGGPRDDERRIKVQVWQHEDGDWAITEAFIGRNRTCVVRTGTRLHLLY